MQQSDAELVKQMKVDRSKTGRISAAAQMPDQGFDSITHQISLGVKDSVPGVSSEEDGQVYFASEKNNVEPMLIMQPNNSENNLNN